MDGLSGMEGGPWRGVLFHGASGREGGGRGWGEIKQLVVSRWSRGEHCGEEDATVAVRRVSQPSGLGSAASESA